MKKDSGLADLEKMLKSSSRGSTKVKGEELVVTRRDVLIQVNAFADGSYGFSARHHKENAPDERGFRILNGVFRKEGEVSESGEYVFHNFNLKRNELDMVHKYLALIERVKPNELPAIFYV